MELSGRTNHTGLKLADPGAGAHASPWRDNAAADKQFRSRCSKQLMRHANASTREEPRKSRMLQSNHPSASALLV
jgi:hypothetical protein